MKKRLVFSALISAISFNVFATSPQMYPQNECISDINSRYYGDSLVLRGCGLQDKDMLQVRAFIANGHPVSILELDNNNIGPEGAKELAKNLHVQFLYVRNNHIGDAGVKAFANISEMLTLDAQNNYIGASGAQTLANHPKLQYVNLDFNQIGDVGAKALANDKNLTSISVNQNNLGPESIIALAHDNTLLGLGVGGNQLDKTALRELEKADNLEGLDISYSLLDLDDVAAFNQMPKLSGLDISGFQVGDAVAEILSTNDRIKYLGLDDTDLYNGTEYLAKMPNLYYLDASNNPSLGDNGVSMLANSPNLWFVNISNDDVHDDGVINLIKASHVGFIIAINNHIGEAGIKALDQAHVLYVLYADEFKLNSKSTTSVKTFRKNYLQFCNGKHFLMCKAYLKNLQ